MVLYEITLANEYTEDVLKEVSIVMDLHYNNEDLKKCISERNMRSINNLFTLKNNKKMVCIDCNDRDWLFLICIICNENEAVKVKEVLLKWDNISREEYSQQLRNDLDNEYYNPNSCLKQIEKFYNIRLW
ncbi:MAG: hypothetical protein IJ583_17705 [Firmicutes bacterium]|nr:hypothetical protein [Bacillota bacterium]